MERDRTLEVQLAVLTTTLGTVAERLGALEAKVDDLDKSLTRYRGAMWGIVWVSTIMWGLFTAFKDQIVRV